MRKEVRKEVRMQNRITQRITQRNRIWLVTGFKLNKPDGVGSGYDAPTPTKYASTLTRSKLGAGNKTIAQQNNNSSLLAEAFLCLSLCKQCIR